MLFCFRGGAITIRKKKETNLYYRELRSVYLSRGAGLVIIGIPTTTTEGNGEVTSAASGTTVERVLSKLKLSQEEEVFSMGEKNNREKGNT